MKSAGLQDSTESNSKKLKEIAVSCFKLGTIGFGGIAGMVATIENEMVVKRKWIDHQHFMDVLSTSYIIPGPNAVEVVMHCGKERGGRLGLIVAGVCYILPAMVICLAFGYFYQKYSALPDVQQFIFGIRLDEYQKNLTNNYISYPKNLREAKDFIEQYKELAIKKPKA